MIGKVYFGTKEERNQKEVLKEFLDESEKGMMKLLNRAMAASGCGFPDELDQESVQIINDCLKLWKKTKDLCMESLEIEEKKYETLTKKLEDQQKQLDKQTDSLKRIENQIGKLIYKIEK